MVQYRLPFLRYVCARSSQDISILILRVSNFQELYCAKATYIDNNVRTKHPRGTNKPSSEKQFGAVTHKHLHSMWVLYDTAAGMYRPAISDRITRNAPRNVLNCMHAAHRAIRSDLEHIPLRPSHRNRSSIFVSQPSLVFNTRGGGDARGATTPFLTSLHTTPPIINQVKDCNKQLRARLKIQA
jgi:hypothetical protein